MPQLSAYTKVDLRGEADEKLRRLGYGFPFPPSNKSKQLGVESCALFEAPGRGIFCVTPGYCKGDAHGNTGDATLGLTTVRAWLVSDSPTE